MKERYAKASRGNGEQKDGTEKQFVTTGKVISSERMELWVHAFCKQYKYFCLDLAEKQSKNSEGTWNNKWWLDRSCLHFGALKSWDRRALYSTSETFLDGFWGPLRRMKLILFFLPLVSSLSHDPNFLLSWRKVAQNLVHWCVIFKRKLGFMNGPGLWYT